MGTFGLKKCDMANLSYVAVYVVSPHRQTNGIMDVRS
ncbi:hypothetical protein LINPERHAP2_LOCUS21724 [Linum perenne]